MEYLFISILNIVCAVILGIILTINPKDWSCWICFCLQIMCAIINFLNYHINER